MAQKPVSGVHCCITNCPKHNSLKHILFHHSYRSRIQIWLSWVPLPQHLSQGYSQRASWDYVSTESLTKEDPFLSSYTCCWQDLFSSSWTIGLQASVLHLLLVGGFPWFLAIWAAPQGGSQHGNWLSPDKWVREQEKEAQGRIIVLFTI